MNEVEAKFYAVLIRWIAGGILILFGYLAIYNIVDRVAPVRYVTSQHTWVK